MVLGFGGKKKEESRFDAAFNEPAAGTPTQTVISLRQQGYSNDQIIQQLQSQGYNSAQIFDAMSQADMMAAGAYPGSAQPMPELQQPIVPQEYQQRAPMPGEEQPVDERIEEIAEAIIDEKWNELVKNINKVMEWKEKTEARIVQIEQVVADIKQQFESLHQGVLGKIGQYDQNITNIGVEIKAMEKVFQKLLPAFTENVNELSRITRNVKDKK